MVPSIYGLKDASLYVSPATMATPKLTLYVDLVSPFAYLAFHVVRVSYLHCLVAHTAPIIANALML